MAHNTSTHSRVAQQECTMEEDKIFNLSVSEQQSFNGLILKWIMGSALLIDADVMCVFPLGSSDYVGT